MESAPFGRDCEIEAVGKQRNGMPRFWCKRHQASATAKFGRRLHRCEGAYLAGQDAEELDPAEYPGGIGLWGAVKPVYDSSAVPVEEGVHVHARREVDGKKEIDRTFPAVALKVARNLLEAPKAYITVETAVASYISRFLKLPMMSLFCTYCGEPHLDSEWFAVKLHKRHLCHACGKIFPVNEKCVSNPLAALRHMVGDREQGRIIEHSNKRLDISQADFPAGMQIWASNPALLWTAPKSEEEGIHVHVYSGEGDERIFDDTFAEVVIDRIVLNDTHLRYYMAQQALRYLDGKVVALKCSCGEIYFDEGVDAFRPHSTHRCKRCDTALKAPGRIKKVVSNPFVETLAHLVARAPKLH
ncbi:MAG: hypothetical protein QOJ94_2336 [Sphingomonadales bacterium]|jgi:hypothetical protein|nr:hypothetical protein [Sphingomonadales bacterium]